MKILKPDDFMSWYEKNKDNVALFYGREEIYPQEDGYGLYFLFEFSRNTSESERTINGYIENIVVGVDKILAYPKFSSDDKILEIDVFVKSKNIEKLFKEQ